ncbi:MAG TPA: hypothetical protein VD978_11660 [Azospirillum sp.]|nr:hypothetical protein [Azospirillum sp.]
MYRPIGRAVRGIIVLAGALSVSACCSWNLYDCKRDGVVLPYAYTANKETAERNVLGRSLTFEEGSEQFSSGLGGRFISAVDQSSFDTVSGTRTLSADESDSFKAALTAKYNACYGSADTRVQSSNIYNITLQYNKLASTQGVMQWNYREIAQCCNSGLNCPDWVVTQAYAGNVIADLNTDSAAESGAKISCQIAPPAPGTAAGAIDGGISMAKKGMNSIVITSSGINLAQVVNRHAACGMYKAACNDPSVSKKWKEEHWLCLF